MDLIDRQPEERTEKRTETHACDLISRRAAIDAFCKECYDTDGEICDRDDVCGNVMILKNLPSAQPDRSLWFRIGEICVDESKGFISSGRAVEKIRELLRAERRTDALN